jgi:hypothetical protein
MAEPVAWIQLTSESGGYGSRKAISPETRTLCWREPDSNHRSRSCERLFSASPIGRRRHERRSHLQVQVRNGNACLEWLPTAFPFAEGPRVRIRLPPAESHTNSLSDHYCRSSSDLVARPSARARLVEYGHLLAAAEPVRAEGCWTFDAPDRTPRPSRATAARGGRNCKAQLPHDRIKKRLAELLQPMLAAPGGYGKSRPRIGRAGERRSQDQMRS